MTRVPGPTESAHVPADSPVEIMGSLQYYEAASDAFDLAVADTFELAALAMSFQCRVPARGSLVVTVNGAYSDQFIDRAHGLEQPRDWWVRPPVETIAWRSTGSGQIQLGRD